MFMREMIMMMIIISNKGGIMMGALVPHSLTVFA